MKKRGEQAHDPRCTEEPPANLFILERQRSYENSMKEAKLEDRKYNLKISTRWTEQSGAFPKEMNERQLRGVRQCNRQTNILYLASATKPQANKQATFLRSVCFCLSVTRSISIHFCPVSIDRIASGTNAATLTRRSPSLTHPSLDSDPLLGRTGSREIFWRGVEGLVEMGRILQCG